MGRPRAEYMVFFTLPATGKAWLNGASLVVTNGLLSMAGNMGVRGITVTLESPDNKDRFHGQALSNGAIGGAVRTVVRGIDVGTTYMVRLAYLCLPSLPQNKLEKRALFS